MISPFQNILDSTYIVFCVSFSHSVTKLEALTMSIF